VEEALLIAASFGAALVVAAGLDVFTAEPLRIVATATTVAMIVVSLGSFGNGRLGLPDGDHFERYGFGIALSGETDPGRILLVSADRSVLPGDARPGPGFWYRLIDAYCPGSTVARTAAKIARSCAETGKWLVGA